MSELVNASASACEVRIEAPRHAPSSITAPCAEGGTVPDDSALEYHFVQPSRKIYVERDLEEFKKSSAKSDIVNFVNLCARSVVGKKISDITQASSAVLAFQEFMDKLYNMIDDIPPIHQPMRYGNKAFRQWYARMVTESESFLKDFLPAHIVGANVELLPYITGSFGDSTRIDYGTGHELSITIFFLSLYKLRIVAVSDLDAVVLKGFSSYIRLMRRLQADYKLEPAGSHGVWGLDDYHCLTFVWGSSQLINHEYISPSSIHDLEILRDESSEYLYLEGISFIRRIKSLASFGETSPMLNDISNLSDWKRVYTGLVRLFEGEVLFKLPVVQHVVFGSLLPGTWEPTAEIVAPQAHHVSTLATATGERAVGEQTKAPWARTAAPWAIKPKI